MTMSEALVVLADIANQQWGLLTTAQAVAAGVSRPQLQRLTKAGHLDHVLHGAWHMTAAPSGPNTLMHATWLTTDPERTVRERMDDGPDGVIASGTTAAVAHEIGDFRISRFEFTSARRRQSRRSDLKYRHRTLASDEVTLVDGMAATTADQTIADLVATHTDLSLVHDCLVDGLRKQLVDSDHLKSLLGPLAKRHGLPRGDGQGMFDLLLPPTIIRSDSIGFTTRFGTPTIQLSQATQEVIRAAIAPALSGATESVRQAIGPQLHRQAGIEIAQKLTSAAGLHLMSSVTEQQRRDIAALVSATITDPDTEGAEPDA